MKRILRAFIAGSLLALLFNSIFFKLFERSLWDQILLQVFLTAALGYCIYWGHQIWPENLELRKKYDLLVAALPEKSTVQSFFREHFWGMLLGVLFFGVYFGLGLFFNQPGIAQVDNFFEADTMNWIERIAGVAGHEETMRAPHPFAYLLLRPLGWIFNLIFPGPYLTATFLTAGAGGSAVFLVYLFSQFRTKNTFYAILMGGLFGLSTSNMVYGSVVESYIFAGVILLAFYFFLLNREKSEWALWGLSLISFGITITNFVQTWLGYIASRPKFNRVIRFTGLVISVGIILNIVQAAWYPSSEIFFLRSGSEAETRFLFSVFQEPSWKIVGRLTLLTRTMLLYSIVAPLPFVVIARPGTFPYFQFYQKIDGMFLYGDYSGLGQIVVLLWLLLFVLATLAFVIKTIRRRQIDIAFGLVLCLIFNFLLHFNYGDEPILYSAHWTYALVLWVSIGCEQWAAKRWLQGGLILFLIGLVINQWQFFQFVISTMIAHLGSG